MFSGVSTHCVFVERAVHVGVSVLTHCPQLISVPIPCLGEIALRCLLELGIIVDPAGTVCLKTSLTSGSFMLL